MRQIVFSCALIGRFNQLIDSGHGRFLLSVSPPVANHPESHPLMHVANVHTVPMAGPGDVSQVAALFEKGVSPQDVVAVIAQTEGDGFARGFASLAMEGLFASKLGIAPREVFERIPMLMIGGTAGLMHPHFTLFTKSK